MQLGTIKELESGIDESVRAVIRQVVVDQIDETIKQLKAMYISINLDDPAQETRDRFGRETWIEARPAGIIYRFYVHTVNVRLIRLYTRDTRTSSAYLPLGAFVRMINDLKTSIMKGDMDQQFKSSTNTIIYERMKQVKEDSQYQ